MDQNNLNVQSPVIEEEEKTLNVEGIQSNALLPHLDENARQRFEDKVDRSAGPNACHPWTGAITNGYGRFSLANKPRLAHRVAWVMANEQEVPADREVHHTCENRSCVNPAHLQLQTHAENMKAVKGPLSEAEYRHRAHAHWDREGIAPLPADAGVEFLAWTWKAVHRKAGLFAPPVGPPEKKVLKGLLQLAGEQQQLAGEQQAFLALCEVIRSWDEFRVYAAREYGLWHGNPDWAPRRPVLSDLRQEGIAAVLNFWREPERRAQETRAAIERRMRAAVETRAREEERRTQCEHDYKAWRAEWAEIHGEEPLTPEEGGYLDLEGALKLAKMPWLDSDAPTLGDAQQALDAFKDQHPEIRKRLLFRLWSHRRRRSTSEAS